MWRPRLPTQLEQLSTIQLQLIKSRIQIATIRRVSYLENPKEPLPLKFQYKRPKPDAYGNGPYGPSPFNDGSRVWYPDAHVDRTCDELRRLINRLIDSREIAIGDLCRMVKVSSKSYNCFMGQNGKWKGSKTATYARGLHYFQQREEAGVKISRKTIPKAKIPLSKTKPALLSIDGQTLDSVPVYDTCHEIRRKINVHMRQFGVTPKGFLQDLSAQYYLTPTKIKNSDLEKFRGAQGPNCENANPVFYAAYVFFEKIRVGAGKKKTKLRERVEELYAETGGMNTKTPSDKYGSWIGAPPRNTSFCVDKYGTAKFWGSAPQSYGQHGPLTPKQILLYATYREQDYLKDIQTSEYTTVI